MRKVSLIPLLLFCCYSLSAQVNYVLNPSLEQYSRCPSDLDQIKFANFWSPIDTFNHPPVDSFGDPNCTAEYCNTCGTGAGAIPANGYFYNRYPHTGNGMAQVVMFSDTVFGPYQRDYLQGRLYKALTAGKSYCVTFYVNLEQKVDYASNHIGAYLDNGQIDTAVNTCGLPQTQYTPQVVENNVIIDTPNWVKIEGSFIANGTERFITIGNFSDWAHTSHVISNPIAGGPISAYLVDDISVIESNTKAYAGLAVSKGAKDSVLLGRDETIPGIKWWRDGVLIDSLHAGLWCKDSMPGLHTYKLSQTLCGVTTWDSVKVTVWPLSVSTSHSAISDVRAWPNPVMDELNIEIIAPPANNDMELKILDVVGRELYSSTFHQSQIIISTKYFAKGVYFLQLINKDGDKKVIKVLKE